MPPNPHTLRLSKQAIQIFTFVGAVVVLALLITTTAIVSTIMSRQYDDYKSLASFVSDPSYPKCDVMSIYRYI